MFLKNPFYFFTILTMLNIVAYGLNISISKYWDNKHNYKNKVSKKELQTSIIILFTNIIIAIPGFILWKNNIINFSNQHFLVSFVVIFMLMDFLLYVLHWISHNLHFLKNIHAKHHEHTTKFNSVSLYYMSYFEAIMFGLVLTLIVIIFSFNIYGFIGFLIFNWLYGVITHLNVGDQKSTILFFTTNVFHKNHHELNNKNYGFYTVLWDKIFKTYR